jgi:hypothetical protein
MAAGQQRCINSCMRVVAAQAPQSQQLCVSLQQRNECMRLPACLAVKPSTVCPAAGCVQVRLGSVSRVWLPGLFGLGPLLTLQQLEVGPGPAEKSSAQVRRAGGRTVTQLVLCLAAAVLLYAGKVP